MSLDIFNRLIAIVENGTYGGTGLGATGLRTFPENLDSMPKPCVLILPRASSEWAKESSNHWQSDVVYSLSYYIQEVGGNDAQGLAKATNFEALAAKIFLSRLQLQLLNASPRVPSGVRGDIRLRCTSNLAVPISYPPSLSPQQGAKLYWGFIHEITIPTRIYVEELPQG